MLHVDLFRPDGWSRDSMSGSLSDYYFLFVIQKIKGKIIFYFVSKILSFFANFCYEIFVRNVFIILIYQILILYLMLGLPGSAVKAAAVVVPASDTAAPGLPPAAASSPAAATASSPKPSAAPTAKQVQGLRRN